MISRTVLVAILVVLAPAVVAGPVITVPEKSHDAGDVEQGGVIEHAFVLRNTGDEVLAIESVRPSCGCTLAGSYERRIPPGGEGKLPLSVDTAKFHGQISKTVTVSSNATNEGRLILQIKARVVVPLEVLPDARVYVNARAGQEVLRSLLLRPQREGLKVTGVSSDNPLVTAKLDAVGAVAEGADLDVLAARLTPQAGDQWLRIKVSGEAPVGVLEAKVLVATTDPRLATVEVPVRANVRDRQRAAASPAAGEGG